MIAIPKNYFHDRLILLLLSTDVFLAFTSSLWVLFKLDGGRSAGYIVQYRASLGISALKTGQASELIGFITFAILVLVVHTALSMRSYHIKRQVSIIILGLGALLLLMAMIVSNALLVLR